MQSVQALTGHADGAGIDVVSGEFVGTHPTDRFRLVVVLWYGAVRSDDEKPNVEMEVRSVCGRIDLVDVDVDRDRVDPQALDARLLGRLAQRDRGQVGVTVAVSARLQPALQLGVEQQEDVLGRGIDDQRGAGQMALEAAAVEGVVVGTDEVEDRATMALGIGVDLGRDDGSDGIVQRGRRLQVGVSGIEHGPDPTSVRYETVSAAVPILGRHDAVGPVVDLDSERAALARLWPGREELAALRPIARAGVPTLEGLTEGFPVEAIRTASGQQRAFFGLLEVQRTDAASEGDSPHALTRLAEARLARGDLEGAVAAVSRLEGDPAEAAQGWLLSAEARLTVESSLTTLRATAASMSALNRFASASKAVESCRPALHCGLSKSALSHG